MTNNQELDNRLLCCAKFARKGKVAADIGSDHAYLPIYLIKQGISSFAIASDINEGPVNRAKINISISGLSDKIIAIKADGLDEAAKHSPDDIIIAGMGGELIRDIIDASEYVKSNNVRLILQPMTMPDVLRKYLADSGFDITDECICTAAGKCYQVICAAYDGAVREFDSISLLLGAKNIERMKISPTADDLTLLQKTLDGAKHRIDGRKRSQDPDADAIRKDEKLIEFCEALLCAEV